MVKGFMQHLSESKGRNLASTVLCVAYSLNSGASDSESGLSRGGQGTPEHSGANWSILKTGQMTV